MNPRCPVVTLTPDECDKLRALALERGVKVAARMVGISDDRAYFKATARLPVSRLTAEVIRGKLDRI